MVERQGNDWPPDEVPHVQRRRAAAAHALGPDRFQEAWSAGRRMPSTQVVRDARNPLPVEAEVAS